MSRVVNPKTDGRVKYKTWHDFWEKVDVRDVHSCWDWSGAKSEWGYGRIVFMGQRGVRSHRLAYEYAHGSIPKGALIRHLCHNRVCCNPAHLATGTHEDNCQDRQKANRQARGESAGRARLTEDQVKEIRAACETESQADVASRFGVHRTTIWHIVHRRIWNHI